MIADQPLLTDTSGAQPRSYSTYNWTLTFSFCELQDELCHLPRVCFFSLAFPVGRNADLGVLASSALDNSVTYFWEIAAPVCFGTIVSKQEFLLLFQ